MTDVHPAVAAAGLGAVCWGSLHADFRASFFDSSFPSFYFIAPEE